MTGHLTNRTAAMVIRTASCLLACCLLASAGCRADSVNIVLPASVSFNVTDITQSTPATVSPVTISYSDYVPGTGSVLRIGLQANTPDFTRPGTEGAAIPSSYLSWTGTVPVNGGETLYGFLLDTDIALLYEGAPASNSFGINFQLDPLPAGVAAGVHTLTATWHVESF